LHNPAFYAVLREQGQPCVVLWDDGGRGVAPRRGKFRAGLATLPAVRRDRPFVAFACGARDGSCGDGRAEDGDPVGTLGLGYRFDRLTETEDWVAVEYWFARDGQTDGQTDGGRVDLLVYQLQRFPAAAGTAAVARILDGTTVVAEAAITADSRGAYRIRPAPCRRRHG
jgi:hypothetical protein